MLKEPNNKKISGIIILLFIIFSKKIKEVFCVLSVTRQELMIGRSMQWWIPCRNWLGHESSDFSFSYLFCLNMNSLLASMILDSPIAKSFQLSITKCACYTVLGLAPYYKEKMLEKVKVSPAYSIIFYESLNLNLQDEQLDAQTHFWEK